MRAVSVDYAVPPSALDIRKSTSEYRGVAKGDGNEDGYS